MFKKLQLEGRVFNRLTVIQRANIIAKNSFWICRCSCDGQYCIIRGKSMTGKRIQSCGCYKREVSRHYARKLIESNTLPPGESAFNLLYASYKWHALDRGFEFSITKDDFKILTKGICVYCGVEPRQIQRVPSGNGEYIYNGIDRQVNEQGYTIDNTVSCCGSCNTMKQEFSVDEFYLTLQQILDYRNQKGTCSTQVPS